MKNCNLVIKRISDRDKNDFDSNVSWKTVNDTTFYQEEERYLINIDTIPIDIIPQRIERVHSGTALNLEPNKSNFAFILPENTIYWAYFIGTGANANDYLITAKEKAAKLTSDLQTGANIAKTINKATNDQYSAVAYLALTGISLFGVSGKGDNVQYWFVDSHDNVKLFMANQTFYQFEKGNSAISYKRMQNHLSGKYYLCLYNDNIMDPIDVYISISAITTKENWGVRTVKKYTVKTYNMPYIEE